MPYNDTIRRKVADSFPLGSLRQIACVEFGFNYCSANNIDLNHDSRDENLINNW
jgi:hypothetical protein